MYVCMYIWYSPLKVYIVVQNYVWMDRNRRLHIFFIFVIIDSKVKGKIQPMTAISQKIENLIFEICARDKT